MSFFGNIWNTVKKVGSKVGSWFAGSSKKSSPSDYSNMIAGLAGLGSSGLNFVSSSKGLKEQYGYNAKLQQNAQQWATGMASTAHQLEVNDMRRAGLNPILSATGGSGASAPSATGGSVGMPDYDLGSGISTALAYRENRSLIRQRNYQNDLINAQTGTEIERHNTQEEQTDLLHKQQGLIEKQIEDYTNQIKNRDLTTAAQIDRLKTQNITDLINAEVNKKVGSANAYYNTHRALGFTDSFSTSDSYSNGSLGPTNWFPSKSGTTTYSHSRTQ